MRADLIFVCKFTDDDDDGKVVPSYPLKISVDDSFLEANQEYKLTFKKRFKFNTKHTEIQMLKNMALITGYNDN